MAGRYIVNLFDTKHNQVALIDDFVSLEYGSEVNTLSTLKLTLASNDDRATLFDWDTIVEVQREDKANNLTWYRDFQGFVRAHEHQLDQQDREIHLFTAYDPKHLLKRRHIMYPSGSSNADLDTPGLPADDAMKHYASTNLSLSATAPPRDIDGSQIGQYISIETNFGFAPLWVGAMSYRNLYDTIREIGLAESVDFDMVYTGSDGAPIWEFRTYYPMIGTDRTDMAHGPLVFSPDIGNVIVPSLTIDRANEANAILVLGQGSQDARQSYFQSTTAVNDSIFNYMESSQSQRQEDELAGLVASANYFLNHMQSQESFECSVPISSPTVYGRDYFLGDKVVAQLSPHTLQLRILKQEVAVKDGKEQIKLTFGTLVQ